MDIHGKALRLGVTAVLCAVALRLSLAGIPEKVLSRMAQPDIAAFLIYLETGRDVRRSPSRQVFFPEFAPESPAPMAAQPDPLPVFSPEDAKSLEVYYACTSRPDLGEALDAPLAWDLTAPEPTVLILHTHTTESYTKQTEDYKETASWRTLDEGYNMLSIGDALGRLLAREGITAVHDRQIHDYPSYNGSYNHARKAITQYLQEYPSIRLVLDLHRDAADTGSGQLRPLVTLDGIPTARLMLVLGTGDGGLSHPNWKENLALAAKLHIQLERQAPGITRPLLLRSQRFNQDLHPGALLVEVGAAGNTHAEALAAVQQLGLAIAALARGSD